MDAWVVLVWIVIAVLVLSVIVVAAWRAARRSRTDRLRSQFGPEYDAAMHRADDRRSAEAELDDRRRRRDALDIRPLSAASRSRYAGEWDRVQSAFVDDPGGAIEQAQQLVHRVMAERGYPTDDFDQEAADLSVDHPQLVQRYRTARSAWVATTQGAAETEELREAVIHYRALFEELLGPEPHPMREVQ
jgi:hypothetical protein